jgi:hypothetical protein
MSDIVASVQSPTISASVSGGTISATVGASTISASAGGGIGPQGPSGAAGGVLDDLADVTLASPSNGDLLRYASGAWRNYPETNLTDGGHF